MQVVLIMYALSCVFMAGMEYQHSRPHLSGFVLYTGVVLVGLFWPVVLLAVVVSELLSDDQR